MDKKNGELSNSRLAKPLAPHQAVEPSKAIHDLLIKDIENRLPGALGNGLEGLEDLGRA